MKESSGHIYNFAASLLKLRGVAEQEQRQSGQPPPAAPNLAATKTCHARPRRPVTRVIRRGPPPIRLEATSPLDMAVAPKKKNQWLTNRKK